MGRRGGIEFPKKAAAEILLNSLGSEIACVWIFGRTEYNTAFYLKMEEMQVTPNEGGVIFVKHVLRTHLTRVDAVIGLGLNPRDLSREELYRRGLDWDESSVWAKSTYDALVARGFPIDATNPVVDERIEPALQQVRVFIDR